ncbi:uncharacterized protein LOC113504092 isoform X2 [Trichoplusia ni]|uniref:Uncharacterized protein LOC113504092 isoform X2 n=1 Tax=Trichoplusia ni TaxID=7111 RepID=A0A7E5WPB6_TRINI|nr:uncharacterized protein LOC113504092 isoform X2 [Trichoplusia ni]
MDLKEIIKWFIPCFHILLLKRVKMFNFVYVCLFLLFICRPGYGAGVNSLVSGDIDTKNVVSFKYLDSKINQSDFYGVKNTGNEGRAMDTSVGRTFGRPMKKLMQALIPLVFQIGAASTWAVVAALVGVKTLVVTLVILKILLVAGAAKIGALFGSKSHGHGWEAPHQKEIHLHIHNGQAHEEHVPILPGWHQSQEPYHQPKPTDNGYYINPQLQQVPQAVPSRRILTFKL